MTSCSSHRRPALRPFDGKLFYPVILAFSGWGLVILAAALCR